MNVEVLIENDFGSTLLRCRAEEGVLSIGRDASSSICLADSRVSRQHALVRVETDRLLVEDRSKNGTLAGDALLQLETAAIPFGTPIWLGFHSLTIRPSRTSTTSTRASRPRARCPSRW